MYFPIHPSMASNVVPFSQRKKQVVQVCLDSGVEKMLQKYANVWHRGKLSPAARELLKKALTELFDDGNDAA